MASSAELAVAKASLSATLFRADPTSCSRDEIDNFFSLLNSAITQCSPANVQKCKQWILGNLVPSNGRSAPLGRYLCALANSFTPDKDRKGKGQVREPSARRKRLHILYVLNDIFYHVKFRDGNNNFADKLEPHLSTLVRSVAAFPKCPKHAKKIQDLIALWEENSYLSPDCITKLRTAADQALRSEQSEASNGQDINTTSAPPKSSKEAPFVMPPMHGDPTMPWYDLPAGNWLPVLEPNSTRPMKPSMIKPLQLAPGPADKTLVEAVNKLLVDVDKLYSRNPNLINFGSYDFDQMGEIVETDESKGNITNGETYYGWSRAFCEKMRRRKKGLPGGSPDKDRLSSRSYSRSPNSRSRSRSRGPRMAQDSRSRSRSSSRPGFKRRRLSPDSRSAPRRMRSPPTRSQSRSRSSPRGYRRESRSRSRSQSRPPVLASPDYSPPPPGPPKQTITVNTGYNIPTPFFAQPLFPPHQQQPPQMPQPPPGGMPPYQNFGGYHQQPPPFPIPPPPPQGYSGQWPPPPPPPPPGQPNYFPGALQVPTPALSWTGGWPAPPLAGVVVPPQQFQQQYPHNGHSQQQGQYQQQQPGYQPQQYQPNNPQNQQGYGRGDAGAGGYQGGAGGGNGHGRRW